eukprot:492007_1
MDKFSTVHQTYTISPNASNIKGSWDNAINACYRNAYGTIPINTNTNNKYQWILQFKDIESGLFIGISSNRNVNSDYKSLSYAYCSLNGKKFSLGTGKAYASIGKNAKKNRRGGQQLGTLIYTIDCSNKTIHYSMDGRDLGIAFSNFKTGTYYLAISMLSAGLVTIVDFKCNGRQQSQAPFEQKQNETKLFRKQNITVIKQENTRLKQQITVIKHENTQLKNENSALNSENIKLKQEIVTYCDEQKELSMENKRLKLKIKEFKLGNIDTTKYLEWNYEEIIEWILSLENNCFGKYEQTLRIALKEEGVSGVNLGEVNELDVKSWGIKHFNDKKLLCANIKELVQQNKQKKNVNIH